MFFARYLGVALNLSRFLFCVDYLEENGNKRAYKEFLEECKYLLETKESLKLGISLPKTIHGKTLKDFLRVNEEGQDIEKTSVSIQTDDTALYLSAGSDNSFWNKPDVDCSECMGLNSKENGFYNQRLYENNGYPSPAFAVPVEVVTESEASSEICNSEDYNEVFIFLLAAIKRLEGLHSGYFYSCSLRIICRYP